MDLKDPVSSGTRRTGVSGNSWFCSMWEVKTINTTTGSCRVVMAGRRRRNLGRLVFLIKGSSDSDLREGPKGPRPRPDG